MCSSGLRRGALIGLCAAVTAGLCAQSRPTSRPDHVAAISVWLADETGATTRLDLAVDACLANGKSALRHLADAVRLRLEQPAPPRERIELLLRNVIVGFHEQQRTSGMVFAGQYGALEPLQPWAGDVLLQLLIETPDWFPLELRASLVPALRDLFPNGPSGERRADLHAIATDEEHESDRLRHALACAFAEWGEPDLIAPRIAELERAAGKRATEDELYFARALAMLLYELRDYPRAADEWTTCLRAGERLGLSPPPMDYYNAACNLSLAGRIRDALAELERCADRLSSESLDESLRVERKLFDEDPELRAVRPTRRFQQLVARAFERGKQ